MLVLIKTANCNIQTTLNLSRES